MMERSELVVAVEHDRHVEDMVYRHASTCAPIAIRFTNRVVELETAFGADEFAVVTVRPWHRQGAVMPYRVAEARDEIVMDQRVIVLRLAREGIPEPHVDAVLAAIPERKRQLVGLLDDLTGEAVRRRPYQTGDRAGDEYVAIETNRDLRAVILPLRWELAELAAWEEAMYDGPRPGELIDLSNMPPGWTPWRGGKP